MLWLDLICQAKFNDNYYFISPARLRLLVQLLGHPLQLIEFLSFQQEVIPHNAAGINAFFIAHSDHFLVLVAALHPFAKVAVHMEVGLYNDEHMLDIAREQKAKPRQAIKDKPQGEKPHKA